MRIGVLSASGNPHARAVAAELARRGVEVRDCTLGNATNPGLMTLAGADPALDGPELDFEVGFVDVLPVAVPRAFEAEGQYWLYQDWYRDWMQAQERLALLEAWLHAIEERGTTLLNPPSAGAAQRKPFQLMKLAAADLPVPPFVITTDRRVAESFLAAFPDSVVKPALGGGFCRRIGPAEVNSLSELARSPAILQRRAPGLDVRVTAVYGHVLSSVAIDAPDDVVDYRSLASYNAGRTRYVPVALPEEIQEMCFKAMQVCGMGLAGIDLKIAESGEVALLECNPRPGFLAIEKATDTPIAGGIAEYLMYLAQEKGVPLPDDSGPAAPQTPGEAHLIAYELGPRAADPGADFFIPLAEFSLGDEA